MALIVVAACFLALNGSGILHLLLIANDIYACGIVPPAFVALVCKRVIHPRIMTSALVCGGALGALAALLHNQSLSITAFALSFFISLLAIWLPKARSLRFS